MQQFDARAVMAARIAQECRPEDLRRAPPAPQPSGLGAPPARTTSSEGVAERAVAGAQASQPLPAPT
jgi:hypothetical protein